MDDDTKKLILARRAKFVAAALAAAGVTVGASGGLPACGSDSEKSSDASNDGNPQPCLRAMVDGGDDDEDADAEPQPCLSLALDADVEDGGDSGIPQPCLAPPPM